MADAVHRTTVPISQTIPEPSRRSFLHGLRQLSALPLIGGGLAIIGAPKASAEPVTDDLLWSYKAWLHYEHMMLSSELASYGDPKKVDLMERSFMAQNAGFRWHFRREFAFNPEGRFAGWQNAPQASARAALVLSAVGCDWKNYGGVAL